MIFNDGADKYKTETKAARLRALKRRAESLELFFGKRRAVVGDSDEAETVNFVRRCADFGSGRFVRMESIRCVAKEIKHCQLNFHGIRKYGEILFDFAQYSAGEASACKENCQSLLYDLRGIEMLLIGRLAACIGADLSLIHISEPTRP